MIHGPYNFTFSSVSDNTSDVHWKVPTSIITIIMICFSQFLPVCFDKAQG